MSLHGGRKKIARSRERSPRLSGLRRVLAAQSSDRLAQIVSGARPQDPLPRTREKGDVPFHVEPGRAEHDLDRRGSPEKSFERHRNQPRAPPAFSERGG